ncbi:MAG: hypothetical protein K6E51_09695, partial [Treponema sp.]|nr:hypothetical protein [Treponema sp.]
MPNKRNSGKHIHYNISELFYSDVTMGNMLHARLVRSPQASGTIVSIKTPEFPAGYAFFTAKDIPGKNDIKTLGTPTPIFCNTDIHYFGEPIGILTGP